MINFLDVAPYDFPHPAPDPQAGLKIFINLGSLSLGIILAIYVARSSKRTNNNFRYDRCNRGNK